jgi:hypothetical protein
METKNPRPIRKDRGLDFSRRKAEIKEGGTEENKEHPLRLF